MAGAGNLQNRTPQQQQQQNMLGPNSNVRPQGQQQQQTPQGGMMGGIRNQTPQQAQQMGANPMMQQQQQQGMGMGMQNPQQNMMNMRGPANNNMQQQQQQQPPMTTSQSTGLFSGSLFSGPRMPFGGGGNQQQQQQQQQPGQQPGVNQQGQPSIMQKLGDVAGAVPGGDMLSKGKELIFMKFGLGGK